jgi:two-component system, NtrC family, sensor histidine kinase HydH
VSGSGFFESLKEYVGFDERSSEALRRFHPAAQPNFTSIVDDFYDTLQRHPAARAAITGGDEQIERLKQTLVRWMNELFLGPHDEGYFVTRARIGRVHVRIDLPQAYMLTAMNRIRVRLVEVVRAELGHDPRALGETSRSLDQILDIELAIMLETYRDDLLIKNRTAERLATIGQFAAGIGHELRSPLGVIESSVYLVRRHLQGLGIEDERIWRHLDKISAEVHRSGKTINDILELARDQAPRRRSITVGALAEAATAAARLPAAVRVTPPDPADIALEADPDLLGRVLVNLLHNAAQAMEDRGTIRIEGERAESATRLRVRDDGPGVPAEVSHRIFEALFTTRAKGTGLGLALCRRIVEAHGGTITLEPTTRGASFLIVIPDGPSVA